MQLSSKFAMQINKTVHALSFSFCLTERRNDSSTLRTDITNAPKHMLPKEVVAQNNEKITTIATYPPRSLRTFLHKLPNMGKSIRKKFSDNWDYESGWLSRLYINNSFLNN